MSDERSPPVLRRAKFIVGGIIGALVLGGLIVLGLRSYHAVALHADAALHAKQYVTTVKPQSSAAGQPLTLPGTLQGITEATVYARSNGYLARWYKDIGAAVKQGDVLAEITAPEIDQELHQAEATRAQVEASAKLAKSTSDRWQSLRDKDAVTQQDLDERTSAYRQAESNLAAAQANVGRLRNLQGFNKVVAPFTGVLTRRNVDVGDLIEAGSSGAGKALFSLVQIDPLRLYVYVPQVYANQVKVGDAVTINLAEHSGEQYIGRIARTAGAIDTATRTMQVEIRIPNPNGALIAGSYVQAMLPVNYDRTVLVVPTNTLLFRPEGPRVATVDGAGRVTLNTVTLGTDFGNTVAVLSGVKGTDTVVLNPADSLADGDVVTVRAEPEPARQRAGG
ncbi:MAG: efflux RND transporter periplasmic adaptor subunit [Pseudomonadota bacterium]|nr:efflux RND transporter periplasmic adaptor subunit [Pseudomonadota bacterium]